jgi:hypothetical protein
LKNRAASSRLAIVIAEQPAEAPPMYDATPVALQPTLGSDELVIAPLVIALMMIMCQILANHVMERSFSEHKHLL